MGLRWQALEKVALKHSSKFTKYELEGSYDDVVHELSWIYHTSLFLGLTTTATATAATHYSLHSSSSSSNSRRTFAGPAQFMVETGEDG